MTRGFVAHLAVLLIALSGCDSIVGAECADGFVRCGSRCLESCDLDSDGGLDAGAIRRDAAVDPDAAVDSDAAVDPDAAIEAGIDSGADAALDGRVPDDGGALDDGGPIDDGGSFDAGEAGSLDAGTGSDAGTSGSDAGAADAGVSGDAGGLDAGIPSCDLGQLECDGTCVDVLADPLHCGACGRMCAAGEFCASGACHPTCDPPLVECAGACVDPGTSPDHCGGCGVVCGSGICIDGECSNALAGHVVIVGHDYETSRAGQNRLAGNALFLARGSPVRTLVWEGEVSSASRRGVEAAIDAVARAIGRAWARTQLSDPALLPVEIARADALLVHAQSGADDESLRALGRAWSVALSSFLARGGVVVLFDGPSAANAGTWQILDAAGLFSASSRTEVTSEIVSVRAAADAVALRVPLFYAGERHTVAFDTPDGVVVTATTSGAVVVHRTLVP